jgi:iron complex transport system permease protein
MSDDTQAARRPLRARPLVVLLALAGVLMIALAAGVVLGAVRIPPRELLDALLHPRSGSVATTLVYALRLPRVVLAALVGAALAGAGVLYQALFRNPLADPYILGVSSGAGLATVLVLAATVHATSLRYGLVPAASFAGALLTMLLVVKLASSSGRLDTTSLLLAGVAVSYTFAALMSFVMLSVRESLTTVVYWTMGGLTAASWGYVAMIAPMFVIGAAIPFAFSRELNLMLLGDERAGQLGVPVERFKLLALGVGSLLTAAAVAVAGLIGFVGLMVPHMVRLVLGPDHRLLLPASLLAGATVLVLADLVARTVLAPAEIPVGIVTAVLGGPFFVWLLVKGHR